MKQLIKGILAFIGTSIGFTILLCISVSLFIGRKTLSMGPCSKNIEESKKYGAFLFEYEVPTVIVYDTIQIPFVAAFAERRYQYQDYHSDSISYFSYNQIVLRLADEDFELPGYGKHWVVDDHSRMAWNKTGIYETEDGVLPPDTFTCYIREHKHYTDSLGNIQYLKRDSLGRSWPYDTIQSFQLIRKK